MQRNVSAAKVSVLSILTGSLLFIACGGSDKEDDDIPANVDAGIVVSDAGTAENDASAAENDAGMIEDDAGTGEVPPEYIRIPTGEFTLSHNTTSHSAGDTFTFDYVFLLKKTPVTVAEFEKCVAAGACTSNHYRTTSDEEYCNYNRGKAWKNHPMNCIDWYGAQQYCIWIGGKLPTEEAWEYASTHNGTEHLYTTYPWGDDAPTYCVTAQYWEPTAEESYCQGNAAAPMPDNDIDDYEGTSDVSLHSPAGDSPLGLVDMSGNVGEWTNSPFVPSGSSSASSSFIIKGGSWSDRLFRLAVTSRYRDERENWHRSYGFRCMVSKEK